MSCPKAGRMWCPAWRPAATRQATVALCWPVPGRPRSAGGRYRRSLSGGKPCVVRRHCCEWRTDFGISAGYRAARSPFFGTQPHYQRFKRGGDRGGSGAAQRYHEYGAACCRTKEETFMLCPARWMRLSAKAATVCCRRVPASSLGPGMYCANGKSRFRTKSRWVYSMCRLRLDARRRIGKQEGMFRQSRNTRKQQLTMQKNWPILT